jgi:hypothetical protein
MINAEDVNGTTAFVDPVNDPVCTAPGAMAASQRAEQRLADAVRIDRERGITDFFTAPRYDGWPLVMLRAAEAGSPAPGGARDRRLADAGTQSARRGARRGRGPARYWSRLSKASQQMTRWPLFSARASDLCEGNP